MSAMKTNQLEAFLREPLLARAATVRPDGSPHIVPVWFEWDGELVRFESQANSRKVKNLRKNPRMSVLIDVTHGGFEYRAVILEGTAEIIDDRESVVPIVQRIFLRYLGEEGIAAPTPQRLIFGGETIVVQLTPSRVITWDNTRIEPASSAPLA
jgi:PPOX class probable F420-dependent enzyme